MNKFYTTLLIFLAFTGNSQVTIDWNTINIATDTLNAETSAAVYKYLKENYPVSNYAPEEYENWARKKDSVYNTLNTAELVIYNLYYPSAYSQNCNPRWPDDFGKYIYNSLSFGDGESNYSHRQSEWINKNRIEITKKLNAWTSDHKLRDKMIKLIIDNELHECIPSLINAYKMQKSRNDYLLISVIYNIINEEDYPKKKETWYYMNLQKDGLGRIKASKKLVNEIIKLSEDYYNFKEQKKEK